MPHGHLHLDPKDPEVRAWAESILKEQDREIGVMRALLARLGGLDQAAYHMKSSRFLPLSREELKPRPFR
jgi:hypothetical protein